VVPAERWVASIPGRARAVSSAAATSTSTSVVTTSVRWPPDALSRSTRPQPVTAPPACSGVDASTSVISHAWPGPTCRGGSVAAATPGPSIRRRPSSSAGRPSRRSTPASEPARSRRTTARLTAPPSRVRETSARTDPSAATSSTRWFTWITLVVVRASSSAPSKARHTVARTSWRWV
jgi:hypothetical protein